MTDVIRSDLFTACPENIERGSMASTTTVPTRDSHKKLKPKPKTEQKSWQTRNAARKEKQTAHAAKLAEPAS